MLKLKVQDKVFQSFPNLRVAFAKINVLSNDDNIQRKQLIEKKIIDMVVNKYPEEINDTNENYLSYCKFYKEIGVKSRDITTPIHHVNRILKRKEYKSRFSIIDTYLLLEYSTLVSFQAYDFDKIIGDIEYSFTNIEEKIITYDGNIKKCKINDLVLRDSDKILYSSHNGNSKDTMISEETKVALLRLLYVPNFNILFWNKAIEEIKLISKNFCILSVNNPESNI